MFEFNHYRRPVCGSSSIWLKTEWAWLPAAVQERARARRADSRDQRKSRLKTKIRAFVFTIRVHPKRYFDTFTLCEARILDLQLITNGKGRLCLNMSQVTHPAYPGFSSMKRVRVIILPPSLLGMLVYRRVTPSSKFAGTHLITWVERVTVWLKCLAQQHNTMSPAMAGNLERALRRRAR